MKTPYAEIANALIAYRDKGISVTITWLEDGAAIIRPVITASPDAWRIEPTINNTWSKPQ
jgi:hypothetical protein